MELVNEQIILFYGWWQMIVCFFAFLALLSIWFHLGKKQKDRGQVWLALSILCWSISGGLDILFSNSSLGQETKELYINGSRSILSLLNSLFILLALPWFRYLPSLLSPLIKSKYWNLIVGLPFVFSLLPTISKIVSNNQLTAISELDVYYSVLTLGILAWVLWESFNKRRLSLLAYLSIACIAITFAAQVYKLTDDNINQLLFSAVFKTSLIMIFFALALSWVKDLSETIKSDGRKLYLNLFNRTDHAGKTVHVVSLKGILDNEKEITLNKTHFDLLTRFSTRRKMNEEGWLEIKPKNESRNSKDYDIRDYNEIKRMFHAILDGVFGKGLWSKDLHEIPLKNMLFERSSDRERKIRLALPPENIQVL